MKIINPHGNKLVDKYCSDTDVNKYKSTAVNYISWTLTDRQLCDLELILNGAFSPLDGFMNQNDYNSVLNTNRLTDNTVWPMPIILDVNKDLAEKINKSDKLALRDKEGYLIAI